MVGVVVGFPIMVLAVGLGAGEILRRFIWIEQALRWAGACYMVWLAAKIARAEPVPADPALNPAAGLPLTFWQAALFQWVNPKAWVTAVGAIVTYTSGGPDMIGEAALLAVLFLVIALPVIVGWTLVGVGASWLLRSRRALRWFNWAMAALLVASLVPLLTEN